MKEFTIANVIPCPICGATVILRRNASKMFQVKCSHCGAHTGWKRKTDAVVQWYNMVITYNKGKEKQS